MDWLLQLFHKSFSFHFGLRTVSTRLDKRHIEFWPLEIDTAAATVTAIFIHLICHLYSKPCGCPKSFLSPNAHPKTYRLDPTFRTNYCPSAVTPRLYHGSEYVPCHFHTLLHNLLVALYGARESWEHKRSEEQFRGPLVLGADITEAVEVSLIHQPSRREALSSGHQTSSARYWLISTGSSRNGNSVGGQVSIQPLTLIEVPARFEDIPHSMTRSTAEMG